MNDENRKKLWNEILNAGDYLKNKLPDHPNHPKGRNPYAHVALEIKNKFNRSYKDISDEKFDQVDYLGLKVSLAISTLLILLYFIYPSGLINLVSKINII